MYIFKTRDPEQTDSKVSQNNTVENNLARSKISQTKRVDFDIWYN